MPRFWDILLSILSRFWVSDVYGITGGPTVVTPAWGIEGFDAFNPSGIASHHIAAGILGLIGGVFHLS